MNGKISIAAIAIGLVLSGCAAVPPGKPPGRPGGGTIVCNAHQAVCPFVPVTVVSDPVVGCKVTMASDVEVSGPTHQVFWVLDADSPYTFAPADGIFIKPNSDPPDQFSPLEPGQKGKKFGLLDKNSVKGTYPYGIKVMDGSKACQVYDPWIINQG